VGDLIDDADLFQRACHRRTRVLGEIAAQYPLPHGLELSGRLGYYDLDAFGAVGLQPERSAWEIHPGWRYDGADRAVASCGATLAAGWCCSSRQISATGVDRTAASQGLRARR
jgi:hypothetical protein